MEKKENIEAEAHVSQASGLSNLEWDYENNICQQQTIESPTYENIRKWLSVTSVKYTQYLPVIQKVDGAKTRLIKQKLDLVQKWADEPYNYDLVIVRKKIIPNLLFANQEIELLLAKINYKFRIGESTNLSFKEKIEQDKKQYGKKK